jgi:predicted nucleotidyltransferase
MPRLELSRLNLPAQHLQTLQALLARHVPDAEVWAYGSRVTGGAHVGSDLDLVLRNPTDPGAAIEGWRDLQDALRDSTLPILVEVHLWPHLPEDFRRNIEAGYVVMRMAEEGEEFRKIIEGDQVVVKGAPDGI